ncbi:MAG: mrkE 1 [Sphingobacterium sp.]|jgi:DNA-binding LytR/AlgR family response regulator|nr:mrkE 1 [Sphingobacterium sp.]
MIKCIVIDDEEFARDIMVSHLNKIPGVKILGVYEGAIDAMQILKSGEVNIVFSDIQMPDMNGISLLKSLKNPPCFVFVTGDPTYALEGYELNVLDYILKPFGIDRLMKTIGKAEMYLDEIKGKKSERDFLIIKDRSNIIISPYNEVFFIQGDKDYVWIETLEKKYNVWKKLIDMEEKLSSAKQFIRIHKSFIVNLDFAKRVEGNIMKMRGNIQDIPIGGQYKSELFRRLGINE